MHNTRTKEMKGELLIVDDDLSALEFLENLLSREGYEVRGAQNGQTALMFAKEDPPELILLDVRLPDMDGFQVCQNLKEDPETGGIPVIFLSGLDEVEDKIRGLASGGVDYITKPYRREELLARVETHLALRRLQEKTEAQNAQLQQEIARSRLALARSAVRSFTRSSSSSCAFRRASSACLDLAISCWSCTFWVSICCRRRRRVKCVSTRANNSSP